MTHLFNPDTTTLVTRFRSLAEQGSVGITFISSATEEKYISYNALHRKALYALYQLQRRGYGKGDHVMLHTEDNESFLIAFWACMLGGITAVPLATGSQADHRLKLLKVYENLGNACLFTDRAHLERLREFAAVNDLEPVFSRLAGQVIFPDELLKEEERGIAVPTSPDNIAYIQYSSGSTGSPKGVVLTHRNLLINTRDIAYRSKIDNDDRMLSWMPLSHDMGLICFHLTGIYTGIGQYIMPTSLFIRRPGLWLEKANTHRATLLYSPNFGYEYFLAAFDPAAVNWQLDRIRLIYNGAEPISIDLVRQFIHALQPFGLDGKVMYPGYGLAEAAVAVALPNPGDNVVCRYLLRDHLSVGDKVVAAENADDKRAVAFVENGYPVQHCSIRICDHDGQLLEEDHVGHIQIKGENVTSGYYNNNIASRDLYTADGWLRTGDLGLMYKGRLYVTGRYKQMIILNGQNYYPQDIERIAQTVPGITAGKVVACAGMQAATSSLLLFVLFKEKMNAFLPVADAVKTTLLNGLGIVPARVIPVRKIPKTTSGKVQYFRLTEQYENGVFDEQLKELDHLLEMRGALSKDKRGELLLECSREVFSDETIGEHTNVMEYGANSLQLTSLAALISKRLSVHIQVHDIFACPILSDLLQKIERLPESAAGAIPPVEGDMHPLSPAQQRFWMFDQYGGNRAAYNICGAYLLNGPVQPAILEKAIDHVVQRHSILRTVFIAQDGMAYQKVIHAHLGLEFKDIRTDNWNENLVRAYGKEVAATVFDLAQAPLMRAVLLQTDQDSYRLYLVLHHIVADGWSFNILLREIRDGYLAFSNGSVPSLPLPSVQYADFVAWQQLRLREAAASREYWHQELAALPAMPNLTITNLTRKESNGEGHTLSFQIDRGLSDRFAAFCRAQQCSVFMGLTTLLHILLYKYTGQTDLRTGTDTAGRDHLQAAGGIGCFTNTLCIRTIFSETESFTAVLQQVRKVISGALEHQMYPFDRLLNELTTARDVRHNGLFNILVLMQSVDDDTFSLSHDIHATPEQLPASTSYIDLLVEFIPRGNGLQLNVRYNTALYEQWQINGLYRHFEHLMKEALADPGMPVASLGLIPKDEKKQLLENAGLPSPRPVPGNLILARFAEQCAAHPDKIAISCGDYSYSFEWLNEQSRQLGVLLQDKYGIGPEKRVGLLMQRSERMIVALLGILRTGAAYVPLDPTWPVARIAHVIADAGLSLLCSDMPDVYKMLDAEAACLDFSRQLELFAAAGRLPEETWPTSAEALAYIMYTSGSTGQPKGVMISREALCDYVATFIDYFTISAADTFIQQSSLSFDTAVEEIYPALCTGGAIKIIRQGGQGVEEMMRCISAGNITVLSATPHVISEINTSLEDFGRLRLVISGGDTLFPLHINRLLGRTSVYNTYGPTETTVCATYQHITQYWETALIGKPLKGREVYVLDERQRLQPAGVTGEICIGGAGLALGYVRPENDQERFISHPFRKGSRLYRTGDMGHCRPDGVIVFAGRKDEQLKIRGYRVETAEITAALAAYPGIRDVVITTGSNEQAQWLNAFIVGTPGLDTAQMKRYLGQVLPYYMIPAGIVQMDAFPMLPNGKTDRKKLTAMAPEPDITYVPPSSPLEETLVRIWEQVLDKAPIGIEDNFFELGGQSIRAIQIISRIQEALQLELTLQDIFTCQCISQLALKLAQAPPVRILPFQPAAPAESYAASPAQRRLWLMHQLEEGAAANNLCWAYRLEGPLQKDAMEKAMHMMIARYEILRTVFRLKDGTLYQHVRDQISFHIVYEERAYSTDTAVSALFDEEQQQPFDLENGPLLRMRLVRQQQNSWILLLTMHHIITDAWSMELIQEELVLHYRALCSGTAVNNIVPSLQYKDYAIWVNSLDGSAGMEEGRAYWRHILDGDLPVLQLPADAPVQPTRNQQIATLGLTLDITLIRKLKKHCSQKQASLFTGLLTVLQLLLHKYSGMQDIIIGIPVNGRIHAALEQLPGCFINLLPLRCHIDIAACFSQLLEQVNAGLLKAYQYQWVPFEQIVEDANPVRVAGRQPLFDVLANWRSIDHRRLQLEQLQPGVISVHPLQHEELASQYDLSFNFLDTGNTVELCIEYNAALYNRDRIQRMGSHFINLLQCITADNGGFCSVASLSYINKAERRLVQYQFNDTGTQYDGPAAIPEQLQAVALSCPEQTAVICGNVQLSYGELDKRSNGLAHALLAAGIHKGDMVGLFMERTEQLIIAILGVLKTGAAYVPVDPHYPEERVRRILESGNVKCLITDNTPGNGSFPAITAQYRWEELSAMLTAYPETFDHLSCAGGDLAYVMYTSGSTGQPKGVMITHAALMDYVQTFIHRFDIGAADTVLQQSSVSFDSSIEEIFPVLCKGGRLVLLPEGGKDTTAMMAAIHKNGVTVISVTPLILEALNKYSGNLGSLRLIITGGDVLHLRYADRLIGKLALYNSYGPVESTVCATYQQISTAADVASIGKPIANRRIYIVDGAMQLQGIGVPGEICIAGSGLATGYLLQPGLTAERFVEHPFPGETRLYRTGDKGYWQEDGTIVFCGRMDRQVKINGYRIEPAEIEQTLLQYPGVTSAIVKLQQQEAGNQLLVAYVTGPSISGTQQLNGYLRNRLPFFMLPAAMVVLDAIPLTRHGKPDLSALPAWTVVTGGETASTITTGKLSGLWLETLEIEEIGLHENFFARGGHSLKAMRLLSRIADVFGVKLPFETIFLYPTIAEMATALDVAGHPFTAQIPCAPAQPHYPLSPAQKRLWLFDQFSPNKKVYNMAAGFVLEGPLNVEAFSLSVTELVKRQESLRTVFKVIDGAPRQVIQEDTAVTGCFIYQKVAGTATVEQLITTFAQQERERVFQLDKGPLMLVTLLCTGPGRYLLFFNMHHIISDGWSCEILIHEIVTLYNRYVTGGNNPLPPLLLSYKDFACWQADALETGLFDADRKYWMERFATPWSLLQLPSGLPASTAGRYNGNTFKLHIDLVTTARLKQMATERNGTLFMVLLSTVNILLYRHTGQDDIIIGCPVTGRYHPSLGGLVGFFVNILPIRTQLNAVTSFNEIFEQVKQLTLAGLEHQQYPVDHLIEDLGASYREHHALLFNVMMLLNERPADAHTLEQLHGMKVTPFEIPAGNSKCDLTFTFNEQADGIDLVLEYDTAIFTAGAVSLLGARYQRLLESLLDAGEMLPGENDLLTAEELALKESTAALVFNFNVD